MEGAGSINGWKPSSSARQEQQSKMGEKRVSRTAKLRKVFGHPPSLTGPKHRSGQASTPAFLPRIDHPDADPCPGRFV